MNHYDMNHHDEFDEILRDALGEYREAEPLAGIEERVLARLHSQPVGRRRAWWMWGAIATCAALVLIGVWLRVENPTPPRGGEVGHPAPPIVAEAPANPAPDLPPESEARAHLPVAAQSVRKPDAAVARVVVRTPNVAETRPAVFPLPAPLSREERELVALVVARPDLLDRTPADQEIKLAPIDIRPLAEESGSQQGEN